MTRFRAWLTPRNRFALLATVAWFAIAIIFGEQLAAIRLHAHSRDLVHVPRCPALLAVDVQPAGQVEPRFVQVAAAALAGPERHHL